MTELFPRDPHPFSFEQLLWKDGYRLVAGVDEAGRGALAGPVVAGAVIFDDTALHLAGKVRDSKKLTPEKREEMFALIQEHAVSVGVGIVEPGEIDEINILQASLRAMKYAVGRLDPKPDMCLIDGNFRAPLSIPQKCIIKGDAKVITIGAGSIIAKVTRDRLMVEMADRYPNYDFKGNKGYGTETHIAALHEFGATPEHRKTFAPVSTLP